MKLESIVIEPDTPAQASVIWMHGLGANGNDFAPLIPQLDLPDDLHIRFIFPNAPMQAVTINGGFIMPAWYDIMMTDLGRQVDEKGIRATCRNIEELIAAEVARGIPAHRIALAGFSQGGAIALHTALCHAEQLAGVMALSTYLPIPEILDGEASPRTRNLPVFMAHGTLDPIVPVALATKSRDLLQQAGYKVEWHSYYMPHSVCPEEVTHIAAWLAHVLK